MLNTSACTTAISCMGWRSDERHTDRNRRRATAGPSHALWLRILHRCGLDAVNGQPMRCNSHFDWRRRKVGSTCGLQRNAHSSTKSSNPMDGLHSRKSPTCSSPLRPSTPFLQHRADLQHPAHAATVTTALQRRHASRAQKPAERRLRSARRAWSGKHTWRRSQAPQQTTAKPDAQPLALIKKKPAMFGCWCGCGGWTAVTASASRRHEL